MYIYVTILCTHVKIYQIKFVCTFLLIFPLFQPPSRSGLAPPGQRLERHGAVGRPAWEAEAGQVFKLQSCSYRRWNHQSGHYVGDFCMNLSIRNRVSIHVASALDSFRRPTTFPFHPGDKLTKHGLFVGQGLPLPVLGPWGMFCRPSHPSASWIQKPSAKRRGSLRASSWRLSPGGEVASDLNSWVLQPKWCAREEKERWAEMGGGLEMDREAHRVVKGD